MPGTQILPFGNGLHVICPFVLLPGEGKEEIAKVTFKELRQRVALFAAAMRKMGVRKADRVVGECFWRLPRSRGRGEWLGRLAQLLRRVAKHVTLGLRLHMRGKK